MDSCVLAFAAFASVVERFLERARVVAFGTAGATLVVRDISYREYRGHS